MNFASVGIDLGSSKFVIGVAKKGGVEVLTNDASYRSTPTLVSYGPERIVGDKAVQKIKKNITNSILLPPRFIGEMTQEQLTLEKQFNFSKVALNENKVPIFSVNYEGENIKVNIEQVLSGVFKEALDVLKMNNIDEKEAVVSVPSYYGQHERQIIIDSAKIAGLEIRKLYNESAANVMNYGIFRMNDLDAATPRLVAFVDMGHSKTTMFLSNIWKGKAEIIYETSDMNLGTRNLDLNMLNFYLNMFEKKHRVDLRESPKSIFRLLESIEKQRKVLTANPEAPCSIDCLYEEIDFNHLLNREEFESINQSVIQQLSNMVKGVLKELSPELLKTLHSVERIGGGTRIPFVEKILASSFKFDMVSKTLDANESVARGCAIQSAMLSPHFKVANYNVTEKLVYPIFVKLQYQGEEEKKKELFKAGTEFNKNLSIVIQKSAPLHVALVINNRFTKEERIIANATLEKITPKEEKFEGKVYFMLDRNGMAQIERSELRETYFVEEKIPVKKEEKAKTEDPSKMEIEKNEPAKEEFTIEKKEKSRITPLNVNSKTHYGLDRTHIDQYKQFEASIIHKENLAKETQVAKYSLESFIYETRNKINEGKNSILSTPIEKNTILQNLQQAENWLYEEGVNSSKQLYEQHLTQLKTISNCFTSRLIKSELSRNYWQEAIPAFRDFQGKNAEMIKHASPVHLNELNQKLQEGQEQLHKFEVLFNNFGIHAVDAFDFEEKKNTINKIYESLNNVLGAIKKEKETKELEAKKKAEEAKKKADEEKKKAEEERKKAEKPEEAKEETGKMEIEK